MAREQQVILRRDGEGIAHEGTGVKTESASHAAGYAAPWSEYARFAQL